MSRRITIEWVLTKHSHNDGLPHEKDSLTCVSTTSLMLQCRTTSDPETVLQLPLTQQYYQTQFSLAGWTCHVFFIPPNHLPPKSIHLDHRLLRVFASILPFLPHTICLSFPAFLPQSFYYNFFLACPPSLACFFFRLSTSVFAVCIKPTQCAPYTASWLSKFHDNLETYQLMIGTDSSHAWFTATC